jgi:hypothetical protein
MVNCLRQCQFFHGLGQNVGLLCKQGRRFHLQTRVVGVCEALVPREVVHDQTFGIVFLFIGVKLNK